jgi:hypothetical protein
VFSSQLEVELAFHCFQNLTKVTKAKLSTGWTHSFKVLLLENDAKSQSGLVWRRGSFSAVVGRIPAMTPAHGAAHHHKEVNSQELSSLVAKGVRDLSDGL